MFSKRFNIIRFIVIFLTLLGLITITYYDSKEELHEDSSKEEIKVTKNTVIDAAKKYVSNNKDYFSDILKEDIEYRLPSSILVDKKYMEYDANFIGYIKITKDNYEFIKEDNLLIDKIVEESSIFKEVNNENMPFDINYLFKNNPDNYIRYNDELYRIIGITNSNHLKVVKLSKDVITKTDKSINFFSSNEDEGEVKGIFYVGYVRSETNEIDQIIKNEKRNNNYTVVIPKYYGYTSYTNISDIINASNDCKFNKITDINTENCNSYLLDLLKGTYLVTTLEDNMVYYVNEEGKVEGKKLTENINVNKVIYINGVSKYKGGNGKIDNPFIFE